MKRIGNLWPQMISFESLLKAANKAQKGKRFRPDVAAFVKGKVREIHLLHMLHLLRLYDIL